MSVPTLLSLSRRLGADLQPAAGVLLPDREVTAVHVSELLDPTGYLSGGELLLTTGLQVPTSRWGCERYVDRLVGAGVSGLAFGVGPVHQRVPAALAAACREAGLALLVVPARTPFLTVTKAYWSEVSQSATRQLLDVVAMQRALVEAVLSVDPVSATLHVLSRSLGGWAATLGTAGEVRSVVPPAAEEEADRVRAVLDRLEGVHSAASLSTGRSAVLVYPLAVDDRVAGYLAVGTEAPLDQTSRRAVLTASALLSIDAVRTAQAASVAEEAERCLGLLLEHGQADAARILAGALGRSLPGRARLVAVRSRETALVSHAVHSWCSDAVAVPQDRQTVWLLLPAGHGPLEALVEEVRSVEPGAALLVSGSAPLDDLGRLLDATLSALAELPPGAAVLPGVPESRVDRLRAVVAALPAARRQALVAYLRHHGQWEAASRELGVHRNTLRYRIEQVREALEVDLSDPDVTAELWLLMRKNALA